MGNNNILESEQFKSNQKHDGMFKRTFGDIEAAQELLKEFLPQKVLKLINLSSLRTTSETLVEQNLDRNYSDTIYQVKMKEKSMEICFY